MKIKDLLDSLSLSEQKDIDVKKMDVVADTSTKTINGLPSSSNGWRQLLNRIGIKEYGGYSSNTLAMMISDKKRSEGDKTLVIRTKAGVVESVVSSSYTKRDTLDVMLVVKEFAGESDWEFVYRERGAHDEIKMWQEANSGRFRNVITITNSNWAIASTCLHYGLEETIKGEEWGLVLPVINEGSLSYPHKGELEFKREVANVFQMKDGAWQSLLSYVKEAEKHLIKDSQIESILLEVYKGPNKSHYPRLSKKKIEEISSIFRGLCWSPEDSNLYRLALAIKRVGGEFSNSLEYDKLAAATLLIKDFSTPTTGFEEKVGDTEEYLLESIGI